MPGEFEPDVIGLDDLPPELRAYEMTRRALAEFSREDVALAIVLFNAYGDHCGWKAWDGRPMPKWSASDWPDGTPAVLRHEINDAVRSHWCATARRARAQIAAGG